MPEKSLSVSSPAGGAGPGKFTEIPFHRNSISALVGCRAEKPTLRSSDEKRVRTDRNSINVIYHGFQKFDVRHAARNSTFRFRHLGDHPKPAIDDQVKSGHREKA
jgi:hypothetical protein